MNQQNIKVKVKPIRPVVHTKANQLVRIEGKPNYYVNLLTGLITYVKGDFRVPTGCNRITAAERVVEEKRLARQGLTARQARRTLNGVTNPKISEIWADLLNKKRREGLTEHTLQTYKHSWDQGLEPFWHNKRLHDFNEETILNYQAWYLKTQPKRDAKRTSVHLRMLGVFTMESYPIKYVNLTSLKKLEEAVSRERQAEPVGKAISDDQIASLLKHTDDIKTPRLKDDRKTTSAYREMLACRARTAILIAVRTGLRKGEVCGLQQKNIHLEESKMTVWSQKNHKWREVPLVDEVCDQIRKQMAFVTNSPWLFPMPSNSSRHLSSQVLDKVWYQTRKVANVKCRYHDLRHTIATKMGETKFPVPLACQILDMGIDVFQKTYCKPSFSAKHEWMAQLNKSTENQNNSFDYRSTKKGK